MEIIGIKAIEIPNLALSVILAQAAGIVGAILTSSSVATWYQTLVKPELAPSGRLISLIWTILYTLMGIAAYLVWREGIRRSDVKAAEAFYGGQLFLNILWSWAFFYLRSPLSGLAVMAALWAMVLATTLKFWRISKAAGALMIPYILWVTFAAYLNYSLWRLNR